MLDDHHITDHQLRSDDPRHLVVGKIPRHDAENDANRQRLVVVLAACGDSHCGSPQDTGLPGAEALDFWRAAAQLFKDTPGLIFSLYDHVCQRSFH